MCVWLIIAQDAAEGCNVAARVRRAEKTAYPQHDEQSFLRTSLQCRGEIEASSNCPSSPNHCHLVGWLGSTFAKPLERNAITTRDMALKHLLNDDDVDYFRPGSDSFHQNWHQQDLLDQYALDRSWSGSGADDPSFTAALPTQSWDQYVNELLGSQNEGCDPVLDGDSVDINGSFQETSADIEQWTTGYMPHQPAEKQTLTKQEHICYGMVSRETKLGWELTPSGVLIFSRSC